MSSGILNAAPATSPESIVESYETASQGQSEALHGASMNVEIEASLPKLKKHGRLHALRRISKLGRITYDALHFEGDNTIKTHVIAHYLQAEVQAQEEGAPSLAVTPANYKFKYKGAHDSGGRDVYVFHVTPRHKQVGFFKGEIWIDAETFLRVRESGRFVKTPSVFLKHIEFVREYDIQAGVAVPRQIRSTVETWLVGQAELTVDFSNVALAEVPRRASLVDVADQ